MCRRERETIKEGRKWGGDTKGRTGVERKGEERHSREVQERRGLAAHDTVETDKHTQFCFLPHLSCSLVFQTSRVEVQATAGEQEGGRCLLAEVRQAGEGKPVDVFKGFTYLTLTTG